MKSRSACVWIKEWFIYDEGDSGSNSTFAPLKGILISLGIIEELRLRYILGYSFLERWASKYPLFW
jgi:hypothetical protein